MKISKLNIGFSALILCISFFSCKRATDVSIQMMNSKCKVKLGTTFCVDSIHVDSSFSKVDEENLSKLLPEIEDASQWNVQFYGRRKMGKLKSYALLLSNGENRLLRLILIKGKTPISNIEISGNNQLEGYSYKMCGVINDDSTITTRKYQFIQTDEPAETTDANDSIITVYRLKKDGNYKILKSDTISVIQQFVSPDDEEYSDEVFFYNGSSPSTWQTAGISNQKAFKDFIMQFRNMVKLNDKDQIANFINYPCKGLRNEEDFIMNYEKIFTKEIRTAVLSQKIRQLYRNQNGVMIGDNQIWFKEIKGNYKIVIINN